LGKHFSHSYLQRRREEEEEEEKTRKKEVGLGTKCD
jgi:hypothetical protein